MATIPSEFTINSPACDAVMRAEHPSPECGGPCATCAFRVGTEANRQESTVALAKLCVEGFRKFHCHERAGLCKGFVAALNLRGIPKDDKDRERSEVAGELADLLADAVEFAVAEQNRG